MSKSKIKLQPISVRSPLPQGVSIPALPLPQQELITVNHPASPDRITNTGSTGITDTGNLLSHSDVEPADKIFSDKDVSALHKRLPELPSYIEGKTRSVWRFLAEKANTDSSEKGELMMVKATRREIARGAGIGSLDTVDRSLARLQGLGFIDIERTRGVNDGNIIQIKSHDKHPDSQERAWDEIANVLEQSVNLIKQRGRNLSPNQLIQWSQLADRAFRLVSSAKDKD